jgi:hypothetical protein
MYPELRRRSVLHGRAACSEVATRSRAIAALIGSGLFIWIAGQSRGGKNWARITGTVFFGIGVLSALGGLRMAEAPLVKVWPFASVLAGLVAVILLWQGTSSNFFNASKKPGV